MLPAHLKFLRAGDCEAYFFAVRKNMWRQADQSVSTD